MKTLYYTVALDTPGFPVRYLDPDTLSLETFTGSSFRDPGEACQEFYAHMQGKPVYLEVCKLKELTEIVEAWKELQRVPSYLETQAATFAQEASI